MKVVFNSGNLKDILLILAGIAALFVIAAIFFIGLGIGSRASDWPSEPKIESRQLFVYSLDSLRRTYPYELTIEDRDSLLIYRYKNLEDSTRNMAFRYQKAEKELFFPPNPLVLEKEGVLIEDMKFDIFQDDAIDGVGPVIFNEEYGLFGWHNGWGDYFFFMTQENEYLLPIDLYEL